MDGHGAVRHSVEMEEEEEASFLLFYVYVFFGGGTEHTDY
jgi:hypothetical protein